MHALSAHHIGCSPDAKVKQLTSGPCDEGGMGDKACPPSRSHSPCLWSAPHVKENQGSYKRGGRGYRDTLRQIQAHLRGHDLTSMTALIPGTACNTPCSALHQLVQHALSNISKGTTTMHQGLRWQHLADPCTTHMYPANNSC